MANPWEDGPRELLQHAVDHMSLGEDFDRRIAMISIDNAVEIIMKTYLSLPKRVLGAPGPTRKEFEDAKNSFPSVLDLLEKYAGSKLTGVSLEEIEWYHRIRNEIYHAGHGVTVERAKLYTYLALAILLFENLFGTKIRLPVLDPKQQRLGKFLGTWGLAEALFRAKRPEKPPGEYAYYWNRECLQRLSLRALELWDKLGTYRMNVVHNHETAKDSELEEAAQEAQELVEILEDWTPKSAP